jgi:hypothetical protein
MSAEFHCALLGFVIVMRSRYDCFVMHRALFEVTPVIHCLA